MLYSSIVYIWLYNIYICNELVWGYFDFYILILLYDCGKVKDRVDMVYCDLVM